MGGVGEYTEPLAELRWHYGSAYLISHPEPDVWIAQHRLRRAPGQPGAVALVSQRRPAPVILARLRAPIRSDSLPRFQDAVP